MAERKRKRTSSPPSSEADYAIYSDQTLAEQQRAAEFEDGLKAMSSKQLVSAIGNQLKMAGLMLAALNQKVEAADAAAGPQQ